MEEILLSIVIPTKNRYSTLIKLTNVLGQIFKDESDVEIVIQDNSEDNTEILHFLQEKNWANIKYYFTREWVSVVDNCHNGILNSKGIYVTMIGDDDAVTKQIVEIARIMKLNNLDTCGCNCPLYRWPAAFIKNKQSYEFILSKKIFEVVDVQKELVKILRRGLQSKSKLPCVYHGIVSRKLLDEIYQKSGSFFPGPSPDMANAIALACHVDKHIMTSIPFIIDGYSKASTGHMTETKNHIGKLEEQNFLPGDTIEKWTKEIPKIWLPGTIWPESGIQAMKRCKMEIKCSKINFTAIYIKLLALYPECWKLIIRHIRLYSNPIKLFLTFCFIFYTYIQKKIELKMIEKRSRLYMGVNICSISEAIKYTETIIQEEGLIIQFREAIKNNMGGSLL